MKKLTLALATTLALSSAVSATESHDTKFEFRGDKSFASFCRAVTQDNVRLIHNSFKNKIGVVAMSKKDVYRKLLDSQNLSCNGKDLVEFSKEFKADEVLAYLEKAAATL
ncbi:hypothetical protein [Planctobacterium marinum]|uniref:hypothetical protein n=1 Tax=Planctobacterium marinum TaxID=1631968 RepID=UPI001E38638A|nr:hypothetical protein [Planctobacterium marinum]MCC2607788.1 hypothetical protein [Planctobacterium marinum]